MRILILGGSGFIGSATAARFAAAGHSLVLVSRRGGGLSGPKIERVALNMAFACRPGIWLPYLQDVDVVVNCAGILQGSPEASVETIHVEGPAALYEACIQSGVRRVILFSAIGMDRISPSSFSASKRAGEDMLRTLNLEWVILRPSVVAGRSAYGGSALFRGLAASPVFPVFPDTELIQIVQLDDVASAALFFVSQDAPSRIAIDIAGPERLSFEQIIAIYRRWLGEAPARRISAPAPLVWLVYALGDLVGQLGWRTPIRSNARKEMVRGAVGDSDTWSAITGIEPTRLEDALSKEPASVQEKWFARLYLLKPFAFSRS